MTQSDINELFYILLNSGKVKKAFFYFFFTQNCGGVPYYRNPLPLVCGMVGQGQLQGIAVRRDWKKAEKQKQNKNRGQKQPQAEFEFILQRISYLCLIVYIGRLLLYLYLFNVL